MILFNEEKYSTFIKLQFLTTKFTGKKFHFLHYKYKAADLQKHISLTFYAKPKSSRSNTEQSTNTVNVFHNFSCQAFSNDAS